jgi:hypothetical protein
MLLSGFCVLLCIFNLAVLEYACVKARSLFSVAMEPETCGDLRKRHLRKFAGLLTDVKLRGKRGTVVNLASRAQ